MKYSYYPGRWQPFHQGHRALVQKLLDEGKNVCIGIRDTEVSKSDPYTVQERINIILRVFPDEYKNGRVAISVIPDIEEVVYGRNVGWGIREIRLDEDTEAISATKIREAQNDS